MSHENPELISPRTPDPHEAIQPNSPDFRETPDIEPFSDLREHFPVWLYLICGIALFLAGSSFTGFQTFGRDMLDQGPGGPSGPAPGAQVEAPLTPAQIGKRRDVRRLAEVGRVGLDRLVRIGRARRDEIGVLVAHDLLSGVGGLYGMPASSCLRW